MFGGGNGNESSGWGSTFKNTMFTLGAVAKEGFNITKDLANKGIQKVQEPEFQQSVKNVVSGAIESTKAVEK